jgi:hypothetical protein
MSFRLLMLILPALCVAPAVALAQAPKADPLAQAEEVLKSAGPLPGTGAAAELLRPPVEKPVDPVAGRKASGKLHIRNFYVTFGTDGTLSAYTTRKTTEKPFKGRYTISGNQIRFELGPSKFIETIKGKRITGTRSRSDGINDDWDLTLE